MPDGSRVGEQRIMVRMLTGPKEGEELETTSSSGYLFGAGCTVGMHVVVMQSIAGDTVINTVYTQDREMTIYIFAALYLVVLCLVGGKQGLKGALGLVFTFLCILFVYLRWCTGDTPPSGWRYLCASSPRWSPCTSSAGPLKRRWWHGGDRWPEW